MFGHAILKPPEHLRLVWRRACWRQTWPRAAGNSSPNTCSASIFPSQCQCSTKISRSMSMTSFNAFFVAFTKCERTLFVSWWHTTYIAGTTVQPHCPFLKCVPTAPKQPFFNPCFVCWCVKSPTNFRNRGFPGFAETPLVTNFANACSNQSHVIGMHVSVAVMCVFSQSTKRATGTGRAGRTIVLV